ncbi:MAG TPA: hypothetical protein VFI24_22950 [Pyrinomonadaceae bacterium]|nr:hypothetical protein [Pyrinomonadaceae bacterium]
MRESSHRINRVVRITLSALLLVQSLTACATPITSTVPQLNIPDGVQFPSAEVEFLAGPQIKSASKQNPFPWFDQNATTRGSQLGMEFPATPPMRQITGTISVTHGQPAVVGSGTRFTTELPVPVNQFNFFVRDTNGGIQTYYIASIADDTHLTLTQTWQPATQSGRPVFTATGDEFNEYLNVNYYDQAFTQYLNYYRTGDARFQTYARKIADSWWQMPLIGEGKTAVDNSLAPRHASLNGLMLRALDGRPEMWPWIVNYTRAMFDLWVGQRVKYPALYYGAREGGYMLLYAANLAKVHPQKEVRAEFERKALDAAVNWYARVQFPDGSWRWGDDAWQGDAMQPFHVGVLLEGMIAVHRLTNDERVKTSILKGTEALYKVSYSERGWRAMYYQVFGSYKDGTSCEKGCGAAANAFPPSDVNQIAEARQLNATCIHTFGYAYYLTGDEKFRRWGDEIFGATFGRGDQYRGLASYRAKEYDESYRSAGKYLAWRLTHGAVEPASTENVSSATAPAAAPTSPFSDVLAEAVSLSAGTSVSESQLKTLLQNILDAQKTFTTQRDRYFYPENVTEDLESALGHIRNALNMVRAQGDKSDDVRLRVGWAAARLKRADVAKVKPAK